MYGIFCSCGELCNDSAFLQYLSEKRRQEINAGTIIAVLIFGSLYSDEKLSYQTMGILRNY